MADYEPSLVEWKAFLGDRCWLLFKGVMEEVKEKAVLQLLECKTVEDIFKVQGRLSELTNFLDWPEAFLVELEVREKEKEI